MLSRRRRLSRCAAGHEHRRLGEAADQLVRAGDHGVGAGRHGVERQAAAEAQVRPPRLVDHERQAGAVHRGGDGVERGAHAVAAGRDHEHGLGVGVSLDRRGDPLGKHVQGDAPERIDRRLDVVRHGAREDQRGLHRLVGVARQDDAVARPRQGEQQGVDAAGRAVHQEEAALAAPGLGGQVLGGAHQRRRFARVLDSAGVGQVDGQQGGAEDLAHDRRRTLAELVTGRVEGQHAPRAIAEQGIDVGGGRLGGCLLRFSHAGFLSHPVYHRPARASAVVDSQGVGRRRPQGGDHKSRPHGESALRAEPHGHAAHRLGAHRPLQLSVRAPRPGPLRRARRRHRCGAFRGALRAGDPRRPRLARTRLGRRTRPRRAVRPVPPGRARRDLPKRRRRPGRRGPGLPAASAARSASRSCAPRRSRPAGRRATTAAAGGSTPPRSSGASRAASRRRCASRCPRATCTSTTPSAARSRSAARRSATSSSCVPTARPATTSPPWSTTPPWASRTSSAATITSPTPPARSCCAARCIPACRRPSTLTTP